MQPKQFEMTAASGKTAPTTAQLFGVPVLTSMTFLAFISWLFA